MTRLNLLIVSELNNRKLTNSDEIIETRSQLTCRFCCRCHRADIADASYHRDDDAAARTTGCSDAGAADSQLPRWMSRNRNRWSRESTTARDNRKGDWETWVVAPRGRGSPSCASSRWPARTEGRWAVARCTRLSRRRPSGRPLARDRLPSCPKGSLFCKQN